MNTIHVAPDSIEPLLERLYVAKRELQSTGLPEFDQFIFVLIAADEVCRQEIERRIMAYLGIKFGFDLTNLDKLPYDIHPLKNVSVFRFPIGVSFALINL